MQSVAVLRPHALLWRNPPVWPFLWRGLLPLAALALVAAFAVGPVAHDWIEGSVARETRSRLAAAGFSWVSVSASGQTRSEEHTSELQSLAYLVSRLPLEKKKSQ